MILNATLSIASLATPWMFFYVLLPCLFFFDFFTIMKKIKVYINLDIKLFLLATLYALHNYLLISKCVCSWLYFCCCILYFVFRDQNFVNIFYFFHKNFFFFSFFSLLAFFLPAFFFFFNSI